MQLSPNIIQLLASSTLSDENADPANWEWKAESQAIWKPAKKNWQDFCDKWYGATEIQFTSLEPLSLEPLRFRSDTSISSSILIRECYQTMFDILWAQAMLSNGRGGAIITGQPGIGKTLFQYYLLVRLLQRKQVVFFSPDGYEAFLFYHNNVYTVSVAWGVGKSLPEPIPPNVFIWSLFDIAESKGPASFMYNFPCLPVQTASSNPIRYKTWEKERTPLLTGLPLWTRDELAQGLQYQYEYSSLLDALHKVYGSSSPNQSDPLDVYPGARALLEEHYSEEDVVKPLAEDALNYLLDAAIDRFGYSARDVFDGVFAYSRVTERHETAFDINQADLQNAVSAVSRNRTPNYSVPHRILAVSPVYKGPFDSVRWDVDFKSDWVARGVLRVRFKQKDSEIRDQIDVFRSIPEAKGLAGRLLEPLVHRYIANTTDGFWPLINTDSNGADSPHFTLTRDSPVPDDVRFSKVKRNIVKLESITDLYSCLENNSYYIPVDPSFPLFDAFTIELDGAKKSAILWVIQVTTSRRHVGPTEGYRKIREIIAILKDELREGPPLKKTKTAAGQAIPKPRVQVRYLVVNPKDDSQPQILKWHFPKGWSQNVKKNNHRGKVYCLEVPLTQPKS